VWGIVTQFEESKKVLEKRVKAAAKIWLKRLKVERRVKAVSKI
jgi:hypothetical protein